MADQEVTLLEAAKLMEPSRKAGVIETYASAYQPMQVAPVINTGGKSTYTWTTKDELAHTTGGKRNVGSDFDATQGNVKPYESEVKIYGGKIKVDEYITDHSPASVAFQEASQIRSMAREFTVDLFEGSGGSALRGVRDWLLYDGAFSSQQISAGSTASGDLLTMNMMDELVGKISRNAPYIYMRDLAMRRLKFLARGNATDGTQQRLNYTPNQFGQFSWTYDGIPIVVLKDGKGNDLLAVTEIDGAGTNSDTCSVYAVDYGMDAACLFASGAGGSLGANGVPLPKLEMHGDGTNYKYERMTWYAGFVPHTIRCLARVRYVKNALA